MFEKSTRATVNGVSRLAVAGGLGALYCKLVPKITETVYNTMINGYGKVIQNQVGELGEGALEFLVKGSILAGTALAAGWVYKQASTKING